MHERLAGAVSRLRRDVEATTPLRLQWPESDRAEPDPTVMIVGEDGTGAGAQLRTDVEPPHDLVGFADQAQEAVVEALWRAGEPTNWPACPEHPANHPLQGRAVDGAASWCCPVSGRPHAAIGRLPPAASR